MSGDGGKFVMIPLGVLDAGLTPHALAAYCAIARHADKERLAWPSMKRIASFAHISKSKAKEAVKELTEKGLLTSVERRRPDGSPDSSLYRLANPARGGSRGDLPRSPGDRGVGHSASAVPIVGEYLLWRLQQIPHTYVTGCVPSWHGSRAGSSARSSSRSKMT